MKLNKLFLIACSIVGIYFVCGCALLKTNPTITLTTNGVAIDFKTNIVVIPIK